MKFIKNLFYLIFFLTTLPLLISGQSTTFSNIYCPQNIAALGVHILVTDSGYIAGGVDIDSTTGLHTLVILCIDTNGSITNTIYPVTNTIKYYPGTAGSLIQTTDNTFAWAGQIYNFIKGLGFLILLDSCLDLQWEQNYVMNNDTTYSYLGVLQVKQTYDSGYILIGDIEVPGQSNTDILLIKTDSIGNKTWQKTYFFKMMSCGWNVIQTPDHGFLIGAGGYAPTLNFSYTGLIIKTDSLGNEQWRKPIGSLYADWYCVVANAPDGNFIVGTMTGVGITPPDFSFRKARLLKINNAGSTLWDKSYGITTWYAGLRQVFVLPGGDIILNGSYEPVGNEGPFSWSWILKTNSNGDSIWMRWHYLFSSDGADNELYDIKPTPDGGFILCGEADSNPFIPQSIWVLKVDSFGCVVPGCQNVGLKEIVMNNHDETIIYPNPATSHITLKLTHKLFPSESELRIFNPAGQEVMRKTVPPGSETYTVNISALPAGAYFVRIIGADISVAVGKFVKQ